MEDWRLIGQEEYWKNKELLKVKFSEFWPKAYADKNEFFQRVNKDALQIVEMNGKFREYLEDERIQKFWHDHCDFCTKTIDTTMEEVCYCTDDYCLWVCEDCFNDFKEQFGWVVKEL